MGVLADCPAKKRHPDSKSVGLHCGPVDGRMINSRCTIGLSSLTDFRAGSEENNAVVAQAKNSPLKHYPETKTRALHRCSDVVTRYSYNSAESCMGLPRADYQGPE